MTEIIIGDMYFAEFSKLPDNARRMHVTLMELPGQFPLN